MNDQIKSAITMASGVVIISISVGLGLGIAVRLFMFITGLLP